jgi:sortase A
MPLRKINNILTILIVVANLYVIGLPLYPQLRFWLDKRSDTFSGVPYEGLLATTAGPTTNTSAKQRKPIPKDNRLVIPALSLDEQIFVGTDQNLVHKGVWQRPAGSAPDKGGNTVLVGHRFTYSSPAVFYHLDKVKAGDVLAVYWNEKEYVYKVAETKVVPATAIEIEAPSERAKLTIYTCTPIWSAKDRLVIIAEPQEVL